MAVPVEALEARLSGLPEGVSVEPGRIEVRFSGAKDAVGRLFALAQALVNDYERFEALVGGEEAAGAGRTGHILTLPRAELLRRSSAATENAPPSAARRQGANGSSPR